MQIGWYILILTELVCHGIIQAERRLVMKPQETKFTFVYNEIKQCRMHFTGISDFCSNIAFTYGFCFAGMWCGDNVWTFL